jgi:hypothetical protein
MIISEFAHGEFVNWARWCHSGEWPHPIPPDRAQSAEGAWTRDSAIDGEEEQEIIANRQPRPDAKRAEVVQMVYLMALSDSERRVLLAEYIHPVKSGRRVHGQAAAARRIGLTLDQYETALRASARMVCNAFGER